MPRPFRSPTLTFVVILLLAPFVGAAELHLRESLLQGQRDRVTMTITAVVDHLGDEAHPIGEDCDLHVPLRSRDIRVSFIAELKNACSMKPAGTSRAFWSEHLYDETHGRAVSVTGVFRIWLEHPPSQNEPQVQTEAMRVPWYKDSNPAHQVELHPLLQVGTLDFRPHVKWIETASIRFKGVGPDKLTTIRNKRLTIQRVTQAGEPYIRVVGTKTGFNHWDLRARVAQGPQTLTDGVRLRLDILNGSQVVPGAVGIPAVAAAGTIAHTKTQALGNGDIIAFQALIRVSVAGVLDAVTGTAHEIPLPFEFMLLDLEPS